ncbi:phosphodiesterase [Rhodanobacter sp. AS-Z3]|uniref:putative bifunctional diguanylate cyclase/phosphodiesterase n=1 Tax=Rhodanobacter sp. AS-Z3 TaxID=3031330 RepID=UPI00247ABB16|nr:phosphodiesterase [Rhodanobacter sp. AS-Z3]WEN14206.1 phosphodiesterase [Rhodanobacter sp. AS-Z3]
MLNRPALFDVIEQQIAACIGTGGSFAVLMLRAHGLREIALRFGYSQAEHAGEIVQELIGMSLRPIDCVFQIGDDSYAVVLPDMLGRNHGLLAAARLSQAFEQPLVGMEAPWQLRISMGIAIYPEHGQDAELLCRRAGMALDEAQRRREPCVIYQPDETQVEVFYEELREAIEANHLQVFFQPVHDLLSKRMVAVESLARWTSPRHGEVSPARFVPFSEQSDLISALTRWSINATLRHAAPLCATGELSFAINLSPRAFSRPGMVEQLKGALDVWGVEPTAIIAEVTETALANDLESGVQVLGQLRDMGVRISIDDFGTGYASISYLHRFPATELKIDQSLVGSMQDDPHTSRLVGAIINMARHLDLATVAEGIENQVTQDRLTDMGCTYGQGFHLGRPEPAANFASRFLAGHAQR